jgi:hypothetical protein
MNIKTELRKALLVEAEKKTIKRIWFLMIFFRR